jgi:AAA domain-containing protein
MTAPPKARKPRKAAASAAAKEVDTRVDFDVPAATEDELMAARVAEIRLEREARRRAAVAEAAAGWTPPPDEGSLREQLRRPRETPQYLVQGLIGWRHNTVLAAQYKTGKTTFGLNLVRSLVDGKPFLGRETSLPDGGRVGWWNGEMEPDDWLDYVRPMGLRATDRVASLSLRGRRMPILDDYAGEWVVKWLRENDIALWCVDSWRRLCAWTGVNENKNEEVEKLTERIDRLKADSGCQAFLAIAHTGRAQHEEGSEHARGATSLDDWADGRLMLTTVDGTRFLYAVGRGVDFEDTALTFDRLRNRVGLGEGNRRTAVSDAQLDRAVEAVQRKPGMTTGAVAEELGISSKHTGKATRVLQKAEESGDIHHRDRSGGGKGRYWDPGPRPEGVECTCEWGR